MTGGKAARGGSTGHYQVMDVDVVELLAAPADPAVRLFTGERVAAGPANVLVRVHGSPVARVSLELRDEVDNAALVDAVLPLVAEEVSAHLRDDGLALGAAGIAPQQADSRADRKCAAWLPLPDPSPSATIVIPTVGREDLGPCLDSLLDQDYPDYEVVVVDNSAAPTRRDLIDRLVGERSAPAGRLRCVREPRPGVSFARNRGLAEATGDVVVFVDDDVHVDRRWLPALVAGFDAAPDVSAVTGLVLPWELETAEQIWFEQYGGFDKGFTRRVFDLAEHRGKHVLYPYLPGQYGTGANTAFRTEFIRQLGGFDPVLGGRRPVGGEDIDVLLRTVLAGARLVYEPHALLWYQPYRSYEGLRRQMLIYGRGLAAVILKAAVHDRSVAWDIARRLPAGLRFLLDPASDKNAGKQDYPADLTRRELAGVLSGPFAYMWALVSTSRAERAMLPRRAEPVAEQAPH